MNFWYYWPSELSKIVQIHNHKNKNLLENQSTIKSKYKQELFPQAGFDTLG